MAINIDTITKLAQLFIDRGWEIENDPIKHSSIFNRYCKRLEIFDEEKQLFLIELGQRFLNIGINDYQDFFLDAISKIPDFASYKSIIIAPLKKPSLYETKSADFIWYHLKKHIDFSYEPFYEKLYFSTKWEHISKTMLVPGVILLLIDDFIGTGETAIETLNEIYHGGYLQAGAKVKIITFMAQMEGAKNINDKFPDVLLYSKGLNKSISEHYEGKEREKKLTMMLEMEKTLKVKEEFELGYGRSESLVAFDDCSVNNTLPVFWYEKKKNLAPFKR